MTENNRIDIFTEYLQKKGLRNTMQRQAILNTFLLSDRHITADDLYDTVKKNILT